MGKEEINLLCTGDLHLGRHPSRIPEDYDSREYSPGFIWERLVDKAVESDVDALLISGDIVDRENRYFEAFGPFEAGIKKLAGHKIPVFAVAGNHDFDILPQLARNMDSESFYFLGAGGEWEEQALRIDGEEALMIVGWSYPGRQVRRNPLDSFTLRESRLPTIGLLHTEVDRPGSNYAPVSSSQLEESGLTGWVVGHIHKPGFFSGAGPSTESGHLILGTGAGKAGFILNPGSPQPLHPSETGIHGPWQLRVNPEKGCRIEQIPLATLTYLESRLDISSLERIDELPAFISRKLRELLEQEREGPGADWYPGLVLARIMLEGYSGFQQELDQAAERLVQELEYEIGGSRVLLEKIVNLTRPEIDLEGLAGGNSPAALLAGYLLKLEGEEEGELPERLLEGVREKLAEAYYSNAYQPLRSGGRINPPEREEVLEVLIKQARLLLDTLVARKEELR